MNYLELLRLAAPEAIVVGTALIVLGIGLARGEAHAFLSFIAAIGLVAAGVGVAVLPGETSLSGGMLVATPLTSLFKIICLVLALCTVTITRPGSLRIMPNTSRCCYLPQSA